MAKPQGDAILSKYLTDSLRTIEHTMRKAAPAGGLPRSLSTGRLDRPDGRRATTEVLLPRKMPASYAPAAAAAAAAHATRRDREYSLGGRPTPQVVMTQARLQQLGQQQPHQMTGISSGGGMGGYPAATIPAQRPQVFSGGGAAPTAPLPPRPAVVRTAQAAAAAVAMHRQLNGAYGGGGSGGGGGGGVRPASAPRNARHHHDPHHHHHHHHGHSHGHHSAPGLGSGQTQSEARVPAVTSAVALAAAGRLVGGGGGGGGGGGSDARSAASMRRGAPSDTGTNASYWRKPITDASYPLTAITDRYAQSMSQSELVRWNDRVTRLEAEITQEKERRKHFEHELKKMQVMTSSIPSTTLGPGSRGATAGVRGAAPAFR